MKFGVFGSYNYVRLPLTFPQQTVRTNDGQFGYYLRADDGETHLLWAQSFGFDDYDSSRYIQFGGINRTATANYDGWQNTQYAELGRKYAVWPVDIEPFLALQYTYLRQNGFQETGADSLNLNVGGIDANALRGFLGARVSSEILFRHFNPIGIEFRAAWIHDYLEPTTVFNSTLVGVGGAAFGTQGLDFGRDSALIGGGLTWALTDRLQLAGNYDGFYNTQSAFHVGSASMQFRW